MDKRINKSQEVLKRGYFNRLPISSNAIESEVRLWRTVLDVALSDLLKGGDGFKDDLSPAHPNDFFTSVPTSITLSCYMNPVTYDDLIEWFSVSSEDFQLVCEFAQIDHNVVYQEMKRVLDNVD